MTCGGLAMIGFMVSLVALILIPTFAPQDCLGTAPKIFNGEQSLCKLSYINRDTVYVKVDAKKKDYFTSYYFDSLPTILNDTRTVTYEYKFKVPYDEYDYLELSLPKGSRVNFSGTTGRAVDWYIGRSTGYYYSTIGNAYGKCRNSKSCALNGYVAEISGIHWILIDNMGLFGTSGTLKATVEYLRYDTSESVANCTGMTLCEFNVTDKTNGYVVSELNDPTVTNPVADFRCSINDGGRGMITLIIGLSSLVFWVPAAVIVIVMIIRCIWEDRKSKQAAVAVKADPPREEPKTTTPGGDVEMQPPSSQAPPTYTSAPEPEHAPVNSYETAFGISQPAPGTENAAPAEAVGPDQQQTQAAAPVGPKVDPNAKDGSESSMSTSSGTSSSSNSSSLV